MAYNEELHVYEVEVTKTVSLTLKVVAHSEEQARNKAWDYMDEYDPHNVWDHVTEVQSIDDNGVADEQDKEESDIIAED